MSNKTKRALRPKLRFPEFRDAGEWEGKKLGEVCERILEKVGDASLIPVSITAGYGFVSQKSKFGRDISGAQYKNYTFLRHGDFAYNKGNSKKYPQGYVCQLKEFDQAAASTAFICFRLKNGYEAGFVQGLFDKNTHGIQLAKHITSSARSDGLLNINQRDFFNIIFPIPSPPEQQKIAACLTSLDELIAAHSHKLAALQAHKKGLLQQLFPAEGETLPQLRFPEFRAAGEWENEPLGEVYSFKVTNSFSRDKLNYKKGSVKNIHYGDIHTKFSTLFDIENEIVPFINLSEPLEKIKLESYCLEGDMIFADASEDLGDVGKSIEIVHLNNEKLVSGLHTLLARQKEKKLIVGFGGYLFKSSRIRDQIKKEAQGVKVLAISAGRLSNIEICYPSDKKEQQKIAACLSSLDEQIAAQAKKIDALQVHKKGLMQQLFPAPEEVGG